MSPSWLFFVFSETLDGFLYLNLLLIYGGVCVLPTGSDVYLYCIHTYIYIYIAGYPRLAMVFTNCLGYVALFFGQRGNAAASKSVQSLFWLLPRGFRHLIRAVASVKTALY